MEKKRISLPGKYSGFSDAAYSGFKIVSQYLKSFDGTKIAVDVVFPAKEDGTLPAQPLPVVAVGSRGGRFLGKDQNGVSWLKYLIPYGYIGLVVETRGAGASYGTCDSFCDLEDRQDVKTAIEWAARQSWCTGKVGMCGMSNRSYIQLTTAATKPEGLVAITPDVAIRDFYYQNYPNGVSAVPNGRLLSGPKGEEKKTKEQLLETVQPVDEDVNGDMAYEAYVTGQYGKNKPFVGSLLYDNMLRDTENPNFDGIKTNLDLPPFTVQSPEDFQASGILQHQIAGQLESGCHGQLMSYKAYGGSIILAPFNHGQGRSGLSDHPEGCLDLNQEHLRWMDFALKGVENGMDQEPPVAYYSFGAKEGQRWRYADCWPLDTVRPAKMYFSKEASGTIDSAFDGSLSLCPDHETGEISYRVDPTISVFDDGNGPGYIRMNMQWQGDMAKEVDKKGITFTSKPMFPVYDTEITGHVSVDLWVSSTAPDGDFIVYMEEVFPDGTSHFIKDGCIRASHRTVEHNEAWESVGATYHPSMEADVEACLKEGMDEPVHLLFALEPISYHLGRGSRLRFTVTCADYHTYNHPYDLQNLPVISLYTGGDKASCVTVPFVEHTENVYNGTVTRNGISLPGTLYTFEKNWYLYCNGSWKKFAPDDKEGAYEVIDGIAHFHNLGFSFRQEGSILMDGSIQNYHGGDAFRPFPSFCREVVDVVPIAADPYEMFLPTVKTLRMNVYAPLCKTQGKTPAVVQIHGYGGSPSQPSPTFMEMLKEGYTVIGVDLRNYPCNPFPDYVYDLKGDIRYIRANADRFGINPNRIAAMGMSLGGNSSLILAATGGETELEGTVGGNLEYSSRIQAAVCGFAWSDLMTMGTDIVEEYEGFPELQRSKWARTDGPEAPLGAVIDFRGAGKGVGKLKKYISEGEQGTDAALDAALERAAFASPVNHISPDCPPLALYGGYGMQRVDIPNRQTERAFEACNRNDVTCFVFSNTQGYYGRRPEIKAGVMEFLKYNLMEPWQEKLVLWTEEKKAVLNFCTVPCIDPVILEDGEYLIPAQFVIDTMGIPLEDEQLISRNGISYLSAKTVSGGSGWELRIFAEKKMLTFRKERMFS